MTRESDLYPPIKTLLMAQGYEVKGEVGKADVVAVRGDEPPVIVELKLRFSLSLFHQAVERLAVTDAVYIAVPKPTGRTARRQLRDNLRLCRRLGLGLITVRADALAEVQCDPAPYKPRKSKTKSARLLREFQRLDGDPNTGGSTKHGRIVTGYRQDALKIGAYLQTAGPTKAAQVAADTGVTNARHVMYSNHYGWFERLGKGMYGLTDQGVTGLHDWGTQTTNN